MYHTISACRSNVLAFCRYLCACMQSLSLTSWPQRNCMCLQDGRSWVVSVLNLQFGRIRYIDLKTPLRPPAFAFVEYEDPRYCSATFALRLSL